MNFVLIKKEINFILFLKDLLEENMQFLQIAIYSNIPLVKMNY